MNSICLAILLSTAAIFVSSCGNNGDDKLRVAVIPKGTNHLFWKTIHAGASKAAAEEDIEIIWKGPLVESDREGQIKVVENFVTQGVDAIAIAPLDDQAMIRPIKEAHDEKMKVVIFDSGLAPEGDAYFDSFVATDNFAAGEKCGKKLAGLMGGKGKAILLRHLVGAASTHKRAEGFLKGLRDHGPEIELISSDKYAGATVEEAQEAANNLLNQFADEVDGIFTPNESSTEGMITAVKGAGIAGKVKFVGFDANPALLAGVEDGTVHALALQDPFNMGYLSVKHAVALLKGKEPERHVDTGSIILTPENLDEARIQELVAPDLSKWLEE